MEEEEEGKSMKENNGNELLEEISIMKIGSQKENQEVEKNEVD